MVSAYIRRLFVDMDGVLADFDRHHEDMLGFRSCKIIENVDWKLVRGVKDFYLGIPPMPDMQELWDRIARHDPIVLTGIPSSIAEAADNKRAWARKHIGDHVEVRCCFAKEKCLHAAPGDALINDWQKAPPFVDRSGRHLDHAS